RVVEALDAHSAVDVEEESVQRALLEGGAQAREDLLLPGRVVAGDELASGQGAGVEDPDVLGGLAQLLAGGGASGGDGREEGVAVQDLRGAATHLEVGRGGAVRGEGRGL